MPTLNTQFPSTTLNYSGHGSAASTTRHHALSTDQRIVWIKAIDNKLAINITGIDRHPLNILDSNITVTMWNSAAGTTIFRRRVEVVNAASGQAMLVIFARDLMMLSPGIYSLGATIIDAEGLETALTWNRAHKGSMDVEVKDAVVPTSRATYEISSFQSISDSTNFIKIVSSAYNGPSYFRMQGGMFTAGIYATNYTGQIIIQGTQTDVITTGTLWSDLVPEGATSPLLELHGYTGIDPYNIYAMVRWIRIQKIDGETNVGTIDKILVRV